MYCTALQKYVRVRRKEAKGTDAEQVLKEVWDGVKSSNRINAYLFHASSDRIVCHM